MSKKNGSCGRFRTHLLHVGTIGALLLAAAGASASTGVLASDVDTSTSRLEVYAQGAAGDIQQFVNDGAGTAWAYHQVTGGAGSLSPNAPPVAYGSPVLAYVNTIYDGNELFYLTQTGEGLQVEQLWGKSYSPTDLSTATSTTAEAAASGSSLVGYIDPVADTDDVFYVGADGTVRALEWSPGDPWTPLNVTGAVSPPAQAAGSGALAGHLETACGGSGSEEVFYLGTDAHVHELWRWSAHFDGWHQTDLNGASGAPSASSSSPLATFGDSSGAADVVFYVDDVNHVRELVFTCSTAQWTTVDLTGEYGAPAPRAGGPFAAHEDTNASSRELYYVGQNSEIYELWSWSKSFDGWHLSTPTPTTAAPGTSLVVDMDPLGGHSADEVYFIDGSDHLLQLYSISGWSTVDVTAQTGAPISIP